jgi:hypothetical protein
MSHHPHEGDNDASAATRSRPVSACSTSAGSRIVTSPASAGNETIIGAWPGVPSGVAASRPTADAEQVEGLPLQRGGGGNEPEAGLGGVGGLDGVEADGGQVGEQAAETVYWQVGQGRLVAALARARGERRGDPIQACGATSRAAGRRSACPGPDQDHPGDGEPVLDPGDLGGSAVHQVTPQSTGRSEADQGKLRSSRHARCERRSGWGRSRSWRGPSAPGGGLDQGEGGSHDRIETLPAHQSPRIRAAVRWPC